MRPAYKVLLCSIVLSISLSDMWAQCGILDPLAIPVQGSRFAHIRVENAVNDDLADPAQGICRISLRFSHTSIGDVRLILASPNGRLYNLINPSGTKVTAGTIWNINFVRCSATATPDQGAFIKPTWDSDQDWGENQEYTGAYYAEVCLEDINTGPVNGIWSLTATDTRAQNAGLLESFHIDFCDARGIGCTDCFVDGGVIRRDTLEYCGGDPALGSIDIRPTYAGVSPDPSRYSYGFVVVANDTIIDIAETPDLSNVPMGTYTVRGIVVANQDLSTLLSYRGGRYATLISALAQVRLRLCAALSGGGPGVVYRVLSDADPRFVVDRYVCAEAPIEFDGRMISSPGVYTATFTASTGCDSIVELHLTEYEVLAGIPDPGPISCGAKPFYLEWVNNQFETTPSYRWSSEDGSVLGDERSARVQVDLPGHYDLRVALDGCADTLSVDITSDGSLPQLDIRDVVMDCETNLGLLRPVSDATSFSWSGPNGYTALSKDIDVLEPGRYTITARGANCAVMKVVHVSADFGRPQEVTSSGGTIRCVNDTVELSAQSNTPGVAFAWSGPNGFSSTIHNPRVTQPGIYTVRVSTPTNGCAVQQDVEVLNVFSQPNISVTGTTLNCQFPSRRIVTSVSDVLATYQWSGPNGFTSTVQSPLVSEPGNYDVVITDGQQCTHTASATVAIDTVMPTVAASDIVLSCTQGEFDLVATSTSLHDATFTWTGPNNFVARDSLAKGKQPGAYRIIVTDAVNRCRAIANITVSPSPQQPELQTEHGRITCLQRQDTLVVRALSNCGTGCTYSWTGPNGFVSTNDSVVVAERGTYEAVVTNPMGCFSTASFNLVIDTLPRTPTVSRLDVGCSQDGSVRLTNPGVFASHEWYDTTLMVTSTANTFSLPTPTQVQLTTLSANGCRDTLTYDIGREDEAPTGSVVSDTINCVRDTVALAIRLDNYSVGRVRTYDWTLPSGAQATDRNPRVAETGRVSVRVTLNNGCEATLVGDIQSDFSEPDLTAVGGGFACADGGFNLDYRSNSGVPLVTQWSGPGGYRSSVPNPFVSSAGTYVLEILGANGCPASDSALVFISDTLPSLRIIGDTINCIDTIANVSFETDAAPGYTFIWLDPGGRVKTDPMIETFLPGTYLLDFVDAQSCRLTRSVDVLVDTMTLGHRIRSTTITCDRPSTLLQLDTVYPSLDYRWYLGASVVSTDPLPTVTGGGTYELFAAGANGCSRELTHLVMSDTMRPVFAVPIDTLDCSNTRLTLRPVPQDRSWSYQWQGPAGFNQTTITTVVDQPGQYSLTATARNGCRSSATVSIVSDFAEPEVTVADAFIPCNANPSILSFEASTTVVEANWFGPAGFYSEDFVAQTRTSGDYYLRVKGPNGCTLFDSLFVSADPLLPDLDYDIQHIDCTHPTGRVMVQGADTTFAYVWRDDFGVVSMDSMVMSTTPVQYYLERTHIPSDCITMDSIFLAVDTLVPSLAIVEMDSIICEQRVAVLGAQVSSGVSYQWSTTDGRILGPVDGARISLDEVGSYAVLVTDTINHCQATDHLEVVERADNLLGADLTVSDASCTGENDGIILANGTVGGTAPFAFSIDGQYYTDLGAYRFLAPDDYWVTLRDKHGCTYDTLVTVGRVPRFDLALGDDIELPLGDSARLFVSLSLDPAELAQIVWYLPDSLVCVDCVEQWVRPIINQRYTIAVTSAAGCTERDEQLVRVGDRQGIFVPNAFTPNGDGNNDFLEVFAGTNVEEISLYEVFDRWGNRLYGAYNYTPGHQEAKWNGDFRGKEVSPGVYIYKVQIRDIRGNSKTQIGDVTLLR